MYIDKLKKNDKDGYPILTFVDRKYKQMFEKKNKYLI